MKRWKPKSKRVQVSFSKDIYKTIKRMANGKVSLSYQVGYLVNYALFAMEMVEAAKRACESTPPKAG